MKKFDTNMISVDWLYNQRQKLKLNMAGGIEFVTEESGRMTYAGIYKARIMEDRRCN